MKELRDRGEDVIEETPSWLSERKDVAAEQSKRLLEFGINVWRRILTWNLVALVFLHVAREYILHPESSEPNGFESGPWEVFFSVFGIIYAIIVGMLIVEALRRFNDLTSTTEQELNAVEEIRDFLVYLDGSDKARPAIWATLRTYVNSVVESEWPKMRRRPEEMDSDTSDELYQLMEAVRGINAKEGASGVALESIINKIAEVTTYRTDRISKSVEYINLPMRLLIWGLSIAVAGGLALMFVEPFWLHLLMVSATVTAMATLYELVSDLNHPYAEGELWNISDGLFRKLAERMGSVKVTCDDFSKQRRITKEVQILLGCSFEVKLYNPSADRRCSEIASIGDQTVVQQTRDKFVPRRPKTPGQEVWTFEALKKGETSVSMEWSQSGKGGVKEERTFSLKVVVK